MGHRLSAGRTGYTGFSCTGLTTFCVPANSCLAGNKILQIPAQVKGSVLGAPFEDLSAIKNSSSLAYLKTLCNQELDVNVGVFVDLASVFTANGKSFEAGSTCYTATDKATSGYMEPQDRPIIASAQSGGGGGGSSSSGSSCYSSADIVIDVYVDPATSTIMKTYAQGMVLVPNCGGSSSELAIIGMGSCSSSSAGG